MKNIMTRTVLSSILLLGSTHVNAGSLLGTELAGFSGVSGGYLTFGAGTIISDNLGSTSYVTLGADAVSANIYAPTITLGAGASTADLYATVVTSGAGANSDSINEVVSTVIPEALDQIVKAQTALSSMESNATLLTTTASATFNPGVYNTTALTTAADSIITLDGLNAENPYWIFNLDSYLVTGARTKIEIINAGANASVIWNTGQYVSLGADTSFIGSIFSTAYVSGGAGAGVACGNIFAGGYVTLAANIGFTSTNCSGSDSWDGSVNGLASGLDIVDGVAMASAVSAVPVPAAVWLFGSGLIGLMGIARRKKA